MSLKHLKVKVKKPKKVNYKSRIISLLRKVWLQSEVRTNAIKKARIARNQYMCNACKTIHVRTNINVDHIEPVIPLTGWIGYDSFIERLLPETDENLQVICIGCHELKNLEEREKRKENRCTN